MKIQTLIQGSQEWHRYRMSMFNASDAPAMLGCSPYETRNQLLHRLKTGITPEVDAATQRRFDDGHRFEALARALAEDIIGEELYPVTGSEGKLSASFDGLTMSEEIAFEHKTMNAALYGDGAPWGGKFEIPLHYRVQMEQQLLISGASKCLFMASRWDENDSLDVEQHCWHHADEELREQIIAGWAQFEKDLAAYVPVEVVPVAVAAPTLGLPAVSIQVNGSIALIDNLGVFGDALKDYISKINTKPETDQDFANLDGAAKTMKKAEDALEAAEANALAQTTSIEIMCRTVAQYKELARQSRLLYERLFKTEKENRKLAIITAGKQALDKCVDDWNAALGRKYMPTIAADFVGVTKGLKTIDSIKNAVDTELARAKIAANQAAEKIHKNMTDIDALIVGFETVFPDYMALVLKDNADMTATVKTRLADHKAAMIEAERVRAAAKVEPVAEVKPIAFVAVVKTKEEVAPLFPTTRADLNNYLDQMSEADLVRTLHFVQFHFFSKAAA